MVRVAFLKNCLGRNNVKTLPEDGIYKYDVQDYDETYRLTLGILRVVGLRATRKDSACAKIWWHFFYWFEFVTLAMAGVLEIMNMVDTGRGGSFQDYVDIFRMMPCVGFVFLGLLKSLKVHFGQHVVENLIEELRDMWPRGVDAEGQRIVNFSQQRLNILVKGYYWCNNLLLAFYLVAPFVFMVMRAAGLDMPLMLPFFFWTGNIDQFQPGFYHFLLAEQSWHAIVTVFFMLSADLLYCIFLSHITMQLDLLSLRIRSFVCVTADEQLIPSYPLAKYSKTKSENGMVTDAESERSHEKELGEIYLKHRDLIRLTADVESLFSFTLLLNFFNSSIIICFCGFCSVIVEKWNEMIYKSFLITSLTQTWLLCWYGQRLTESSVGVSNALYNSGWYKVSKKISKSFLVMMQRSKKELHITTYGFTVISLAAYTTIIKTSWSYFTLLLKIYKK